jgi:hypothetical protein
LKSRGNGPSWAKTLLGLLTFLVLSEDSTCLYGPHLIAPLGWVQTILLDPLPIKIRPFDLILIGVLIAASSNRSVWGPSVRPMKNALFVTLGATLVSFVYGVLHGGDFRFASWQTYLILSAILYAFTVASAFHTAADYWSLGKWLLAGAVYRGLMCWISYFPWGRTTLGESGAYLTTHDDTIGWVVAIMVLVINTIDRRSLAVALRNLVFMLFFVGAIQFNSRRLAWVSLAMGLVIMYAFFPPGTAKKRVTRVLLAIVPLIALYVIVGWGRQNPIFLPLRSFATVSTQEDSSTLARNAENLGLIATANVNGFIFGSGWGRPYIYLTMKYDISGFELWQYVPHNSILGILAFTGLFGAVAFWTTIGTATFFNVRVAKLSTDAFSRSVAIIGAAQVVVCLNQFYGDMGIFFFKPMYFLAISYAMAMRLPLSAKVWGNLPKAPVRSE